jgi:hypothetical protein
MNYSQRNRAFLIHQEPFRDQLLREGDAIGGSRACVDQQRAIVAENQVKKTASRNLCSPILEG